MSSSYKLENVHESVNLNANSKLKYEEIIISAQGKKLIEQFKGRGWFGFHLMRPTGIGHPEAPIIIKSEYGTEFSLEAVKKSIWKE